MLLAAAATALLPGASALTCRTPPDPFPDAPVGGKVGETYDLATSTTYGAVVFAHGEGCEAGALVLGIVLDQCAYLIGEEHCPVVH